MCAEQFGKALRARRCVADDGQLALSGRGPEPRDNPAPHRVVSLAEALGLPRCAAAEGAETRRCSDLDPRLVAQSQKRGADPWPGECRGEHCPEAARKVDRLRVLALPGRTPTAATGEIVTPQRYVLRPHYS